MTTLDKIKGASKFLASHFLFGETVTARQSERLNVCKTSGAGGAQCHNFKLFPTQGGLKPRCCNSDEEGCPQMPAELDGCGCWLLNKTKFEGEQCPLGRW